MKKDMKAAQIDESSWFEVALHRRKWHSACSDGLNNYQQSQLQQRVSMPRDVKCDVCGRCFRRECDKVRHKCTAEQNKQVCEKKGAVRCTVSGNGSEAEEALQCTGVADSIRKLTARMIILTQLVLVWQKQHPYQPDNERGLVTTAVLMVPFLCSLIWRDM